ncbi:amidohydrolase [Dethiosulfatarculus sandiegensis]|uniref:Metal-dependent hydrolase n=1 Tax=Dethiosulfatarculus sandiegensis TaxID=1429043 RepID=A0A0D2IXV3_9BACT|nr:amidohydrolase [Dethiosulfatarculus sandiegensis]KIX10869.1 metal-dependent hydrolase [Dethiosulfatarculus sandiegensis]
MPSNEFAIYSANIFTGDPKAPWAQAVGVKDGVIAFVGSDEEVKQAMGEAKSYDMKGRLVCPGLTDSHCHFISLGQSLMQVDMRNLTSLKACRERLKEAAAKAKPGQWVLGRNWNHHMWEEGREPVKADMDDLLPDNPAMMVRVCGHSQWVNSKALEACGITKDTPDPSGGKYERDENGEPTGLLREARRVIMSFVPKPSREELKEAALTAQKKALAGGLTRVHSYESLAEWDAFSELEKEGKLKIRVNHLIHTDDLMKAVERGIKPGMGSDRLWIGHIKHFADGSLGANTALLFEPYCDEPDNCGLPFLDQDELKERLAKAYEHGFGIAIHAIGDKAVYNCLEAIESARQKHPKDDRRDSIEHVQLCRPQDLERFIDMDIAASVQPVFIPTDWAVAESRWGADRCKNGYSWKTIMEKNIRIQFGSDSPVEPIEPIYGLQAAVLRQTTDLKPEGGWLPEQRLSLEQALTGFTRTPAWTARKEDVLGKIAPGAWADMTIFAKDLAQTPAEEWIGVDTEMTIIGGEVVYQK